jgi:hypothetical protein
LTEVSTASTSMSSQSRLSLMMPNHENPHGLGRDNAKQEVVRKCVQVNTPDMIRTYSIRQGKLRRSLKKVAQFRVKLVRELSTANSFVIIHYSSDVRPNLTMKLQTH